MSRKEQLLDIAVKIAAKVGVANTTRAKIAEKAGISAVAVGKHLGTTADRQAAIRKAMKKAGVKEPDKATVDKEGVKMRKKPRTVPAKKPAKPEAKKPARAPRAKPTAPPLPA